MRCYCYCYCYIYCYCYVENRYLAKSCHILSRKFNFSGNQIWKRRKSRNEQFLNKVLMAPWSLDSDVWTTLIVPNSFSRFWRKLRLRTFSSIAFNMPKFAGFIWCSDRICFETTKVWKIHLTRMFFPIM
jgi:hypothetical protein